MQIALTRMRCSNSTCKRLALKSSHNHLFDAAVWEVDLPPWEELWHVLQVEGDSRWLLIRKPYWALAAGRWNGSGSILEFCAFGFKQLHCKVWVDLILPDWWRTRRCVNRTVLDAVPCQQWDCVHSKNNEGLYPAQHHVPSKIKLSNKFLSSIVVHWDFGIQHERWVQRERLTRSTGKRGIKIIPRTNDKVNYYGAIKVVDVSCFHRNLRNKETHYGAKRNQKNTLFPANFLGPICIGEISSLTRPVVFKRFNCRSTKSARSKVSYRSSYGDSRVCLSEQKIIQRSLLHECWGGPYGWSSL